MGKRAATTRIDVTEDARRVFDMFSLRQVRDNGDNDAENQENIANADDLLMEHQMIIAQEAV